MAECLPHMCEALGLNLGTTRGQLENSMDGGMVLCCFFHSKILFKRGEGHHGGMSQQ